MRNLSVRFLLLGVFLTSSAIPVSAQATGPVLGTEYAAAINLKTKNVKAEVTLFIPDGVSRVRGAIAVIAYGLGGTSCCYYDEMWRQTAKSLQFVLLRPRFSAMTESDAAVVAGVFNDARLGGADALVRALEMLAKDTGHTELRDIPLLFWGHSAAGPFGASFAALHPGRTLGSVRYHSGPAHLDVENFARVPALFFIGGKDPTPAAIKLLPETQARWKSGRSKGAPWTWAVEPEASHASPEEVQQANALLIPWITAIVRERLRDMTSVREIAVERGWLANINDRTTASYDIFRDPKSDASWLPDEATAQAWRKVTSPQ
jgi:pimeloyl-ACP methyl ester carboxylesterase